MKQKLLIISLFSTLNIFGAKDSLIVFKAGAGVNCNRFITPGKHVSGYDSHFSGTHNDIYYKDTINYSPIIKLVVGFKIHKNITLNLSASYTHGKLSDSTYTSNWSSSYPSASYSRSEAKKYLNTTNKFIIGLGPEFKIRHFYIEPKFNLGFILINSKISGTLTEDQYSYFPAITHTETIIPENAHSIKKDFVGGGGLILGYDFKIEGTILFIELQSDYLHNIEFLNASYINGSFILGIKF